MTDPTELEALCDAIRRLHGCESRHVETVVVDERLPNGTPVWQGAVEVFDLVGHPSASRAYAWSHHADDTTDRRRYVAVLHAGPVDSAVNAVRAAIVAEWRSRS